MLILALHPADSDLLESAYKLTPDLITMSIPTPPIEKNAHTFRLYLVFWFGQLISLFGSTLVQFAFGWYLTSYSSNPMFMAVFMLITFLPNIVLSPTAGIVADNHSRKAIIIIADSFQAVITLGLIVLANKVPLTIVVLITAMGIRYLGQTFHYPATNAVASSMVPDDKLSQVNGMKSLISALIQIVAPLLGAVLITQYSLLQILWIDIVTFLIALVPILFIKIPNSHTLKVRVELTLEDGEQSTPRAKTSHYRDLLEGFQTVKETPGLGVLILTAVFNNLFITPLNVLNSYFILYDHGGTAQDFAIVGMFIQAGIVVGSLLMAVKKKWKNRYHQFIIWHFVAFTGYLVTGLAPKGAFWLISAGGFVFLLALPVINTFYITYMQQAVSNEKQGRIFAFDRALSSIATPIGMILAAPLGAWLGIGNVFTLCALVSMGIITIFVVTGQMKKIEFDKFAQAAEAAEQAEMAAVDGPTALEVVEAEEGLSNIPEIAFPGA